MITIKLLTSPTCPYCPKAREIVKRVVNEEKDVIAIELSVTTNEGLNEALKYGISGVPAIIVNDREIILGIPKVDDLKSIVKRYRHN